MTLTYKAKDKALRNHIGIVLLRVVDKQTLAGSWSQNRPDLRIPQGGSTEWKRRKYDEAEPIPEAKKAA